MSKSKYLLSICIPTYNRGDVLTSCINAIIGNPIFCDEIEIVVCDNASTDNTEQVMQPYVKKYPNIKYFRNSENIGVTRNFIRVMDLATGLFLKPTNDYSVYTNEGLSYLFKVIKDNQETRPLMLLDNIPDSTEFETDLHLNMDQVVEQVGWSLSWVGINGFWQDEWQSIEDKEARVDIMFVPIDYFFQLLDKKQTANIYSGHFSDRYPFEQKQGGYNFFKVHTEYFLCLYKEYYHKGKLSKNAYDALNYRLCSSLLYFLRKFLVKEKDNYAYDLSHWQYYFIKAFWRYPWFYWKMFIWYLTIVKYYLFKPFKSNKAY